MHNGALEIVYAITIITIINIIIIISILPWVQNNNNNNFFKIRNVDNVCQFAKLEAWITTPHLNSVRQC